MTNKNSTTLYVGSTNDIVKRVLEHKEKTNIKSFTARYNLNKLVYYEVVHQMIGDAVGREQQLKSGSRATKIKFVESMNPEWKDLFEDVKAEFGNSLES